MRIFKKSDLNGFFALFADNLANMIILSGVCLYVFHIEKAIVFGRILPGLCVSLLLGLGYYAWAAWKLAVKENRTDVTALPYGISTPVMFIYLFSIMLPAYIHTKDGYSAWKIGLAACFLGGIIEAAGSIFGPYLKKVTPRAGMLGTLAGISLVYIATVPLSMIFETPLIGFPSLVIIFIGLIAAVRMPFGMPAGLVAIIVGSSIGWFTGLTKITTESLNIYIPVPVISDLIDGFRLLFSFPALIAVIVPIEIYNFIETMNNVESAEAAGDAYNVRHCQIMDGVGTMTGALFGSCFPTTVYIGHPAYKRLGAGIGYALMVGIVFFTGSIFGMVGFLHDLIPHVAVAPLLVFVGIVITSQAFTACSKEHAPAVAISFIPHIASILVLQLTGTTAVIKDFYTNSITSNNEFINKLPEIKNTIAACSTEIDGSLNKLLLNKGIHLEGETLLSQGAIITGLLWGAITALLIDREFFKAGMFAFSGAFLNHIGVIHAAKITFLHPPTDIFWAYTMMGVIFLIAHAMNLEKDDSIKEIY